MNNCPECGALVGKKQKHKKWHKRNKPIPGPMGFPGPPGPTGMTGADGRDAPGAITGNVHYDTVEEFERAHEKDSNDPRP